MAFEVSGSGTVEVTGTNSSQEIELPGWITGTYEKIEGVGGQVDLAASTKAVLWDVNDAASLSADFALMLVINRSTSRYLWVNRYADRAGDETSWAERVPPGGMAVIWGETMDGAVAGETTSITNVDAANAMVDLVEVWNPSGGTGTYEKVMFAEAV